MPNKNCIFSGYIYWIAGLVLMVTVIPAPCSFAREVFLNWNSKGGAGIHWPGWEYCSGRRGCVSYSHPGWKKVGYQVMNNTPLPRSFRKNDYGNNSLAVLDTKFLPPSASGGGASLRVYDDGTGKKYQPSWWLWEAADNMEGQGITTASADRLSMYIYLKGLPDVTNPDKDGYTFEWGTYTCWDGGTFNGKGCPSESDNGHFYHQSTMATNMWVHILWDEHPSHQRSVSGFPPNNPTLVSDGKDYFANLNKQYFQFQQNVLRPGTGSFWVDELVFTSASELGEPNQNDKSITSLWVGFQPLDDHWEIGWNDVSANDEHDSEYEIRWSAIPITNANFAAASVVQPQKFVVNTHHVHKSNNWRMQLWTKFDLPPEAELHGQLFFAVKDVSTKHGKYKNAPSPYIHTIDYVLPD